MYQTEITQPNISRTSDIIRKLKSRGDKTLQYEHLHKFRNDTGWITVREMTALQCFCRNKWKTLWKFMLKSHSEWMHALDACIDSVHSYSVLFWHVWINIYVLLWKPGIAMWMTCDFLRRPICNFASSWNVFKISRKTSFSSCAYTTFGIHMSCHLSFTGSWI